MAVKPIDHAIANMAPTPKKTPAVEQRKQTEGFGAAYEVKISKAAKAQAAAPATATKVATAQLKK